MSDKLCRCLSEFIEGQTWRLQQSSCVKTFSWRLLFTLKDCQIYFRRKPLPDTTSKMKNPLAKFFVADVFWIFGPNLRIIRQILKPYKFVWRRSNQIFNEQFAHLLRRVTLCLPQIPKAKRTTLESRWYGHQRAKTIWLYLLCWGGLIGKVKYHDCSTLIDVLKES